MRRIVCKALAPLDQLVVDELDPLVAEPGRVVVDVAAAGVNFVDALIVQGLYQLKPATPFTPGGEVAGVISAVGDGVEGWSVGDRVMVMTGFGGFADQISASPLSLLRLPEAMTFGQAASFIQSYGTMLFALTLRTTVVAGETILVLGAGGGIGLAAVDVARALGLRVIAAASSSEKLEAAQAMGAESVIAYEDEDLKARARELSGGGVDVVADPVGGRHAEPALRTLRVGGRYLVIGFAGGAIPTIPLNQVLLSNRTVVGIEWGGWVFTHPEENRKLIDELLTMVAAGRLHPAEPVTYPLTEAARALTDLMERRVTGKAVLVP
ncbi:MAG: NADPH:quinone reductase [Acidimicrobiaceae bacterium]|jgi:NADPH2:quinone reductase